MNFNSEWVSEAEKLDAYAALCQFYERLVIAQDLLDQCIIEFGPVVNAYAPKPEPRIFR
jgi:hypothetical protein